MSGYAKYSKSVPGAMAVIAVEHLAGEINASGLRLTARNPDAEVKEYWATLRDGSRLTLQVGEHGGLTTRLFLSPQGLDTHVVDLLRAGDFFKIGLFGRKYGSEPSLHADEIPAMAAFVTRAAEACLAAEGESIVLEPETSPGPSV